MEPPLESDCVPFQQGSSVALGQASFLWLQDLLAYWTGRSLLSQLQGRWPGQGWLFQTLSPTPSIRIPSCVLILHYRASSETEAQSTTNSEVPG